MKKSLTILLGAVLWGGSASASEIAVPFEVDIRNTCVLEMDREGILAPNVANWKLDTKNQGGTSAKVEVTSNSKAFKLSISKPETFDAAPSVFPNAATDLDFNPTYQYGEDSTNRDNKHTSPIQTRTGAHPLYIDMSVEDKRSEGVRGWNVGTYVATVTVTCEPMDIANGAEPGVIRQPW